MPRPSVSQRQKRRGRSPERSSSRPSASGSAPSKKSGTRGRPRFADRAAVDEDGTPNMYKTHVKNLKRYGIYSSEITEKQSMDWRAIKPRYQMDLDEINRNMAFIPRTGELVLWASNLHDDRLEVNPATGMFEVFNTENKTFSGRPDWRAGVVAQTPVGLTSLNYLEILKSSSQSTQSIIYTGFRLEMCVDPNSNDRLPQESHEYCYLSQIRPLSLWQYLLQGLDQDTFHPSIKNALSLTSTVSLAFKTHFAGIWPRAMISCSAIYIGAELYVVGDAVRISSKPGDPTDHPYILTIDSIHLKLTLNDANLLDDKPFASAAHITLNGSAYTTDENEAHDPEMPLSPMHLKAKLPPGLSAYGPWYPTHAAGTLIEVPFHLVLGRCIESSALSLILPGRRSERPTLDYDLPAIISQRSFSCDNDPRIPPLSKWFWADTRAQALSLTSLNNEDVGPFDETRDPTMWRGILRVIDKTARPQDMRDARILTQKGRKPKDDGKRRASIVAMGVGLGGALSTEDESGSGSGDEMEGVQEF